MKGSRKALIGLGVFIAIVGAGLFLLLSSLDRVVAAAIEKYGSESTGTRVRVSSVRLDLKEGKGTIRNLSVGNPSGFPSPNAFHLEDISVAVDIGTVTGNPVVIDQVTILSPRIAYEIDEAGRSNIQLLKGNLQKTSPKESSGTRAGGSERKVVIRRLIIDKGEISIRVPVLTGVPKAVALPRIELRDLGGKGGSSPGEITRQILGPLVNRVASAASRAGIGQYLEKGSAEWKRTLEEAAGGTVDVPGKDAAKDAGDALRKMFGK